MMMTRRVVGVREIAKLLGTSRQRADQLVRTKSFPDPVAELASGRIWARSDVVRWAKSDGRSIPWATVELELEQLPQGAGGSAANRYRMIWETARLKALGRDPDGVPATREATHALALSAAREVDVTFDAQMPAEVNDEADEVGTPMTLMTFRDRWVRGGDDNRGSWRLEWDHSHAWRLAQEFVANGSGWNPQAEPIPLGTCPPGPELEAFLLRGLNAADVPTEVSDLLVKLALDRGPEAGRRH